MLNFEFGVFHDRQIRVAKGLDVSAAVGIQSEVQNCLELKSISHLLMIFLVSFLPTMMVSSVCRENSTMSIRSASSRFEYTRQHCSRMSTSNWNSTEWIAIDNKPEKRITSRRVHKTHYLERKNWKSRGLVWEYREPTNDFVNFLENELPYHFLIDENSVSLWFKRQNHSARVDRTQSAETFRRQQLHCFLVAATQGVQKSVHLKMAK